MVSSCAQAVDRQRDAAICWAGREMLNIEMKLIIFMIHDVVSIMVSGNVLKNNNILLLQL